VRRRDVGQGRTRNQQKWLLTLVVLYALAGVVYIVIPSGGLAMADAFEQSSLDVPAWQLILANAVLILVLSGGLGLVGLWLAFVAAHLGTATVVADGSTPLGLPPVTLAEIIALDGFVGVLVGLFFARNGLIAAAGVHFWTDVVWYVIFGALSGGAWFGPDSPVRCRGRVIG
jgi:hypothetical protein